MVSPIVFQIRSRLLDKAARPLRDLISIFISSFTTNHLNLLPASNLLPIKLLKESRSFLPLHIFSYALHSVCNVFLILPNDSQIYLMSHFLWEIFPNFPRAASRCGSLKRPTHSSLNWISLIYNYVSHLQN